MRISLFRERTKVKVCARCREGIKEEGRNGGECEERPLNENARKFISST